MDQCSDESVISHFLYIRDMLEMIAIKSMEMSLSDGITKN